jgi:integrase
VYQRTSQVCTFLRWCAREGVIDANPAEHLRDRDSPLRTFRRTFGKVQSKHPGRWLTHEEAYGTLVTSCQDGTLIGLRDEIVLRLGLAGMRLAEIGALTVGDVERLPLVTWTGKGHAPRRMTAGESLVAAIGRYLDAYSEPAPHSPLICRQVMGAARQGGPGRLDWHHALQPRSLYCVVNQRGKAAGLCHISPHDLRRTAAGILHRS